MRIRNTNTGKNTKKIIVVAAIGLILLSTAAYALVAYKRLLWPFPPTAVVNTDAQQDTVNESPKNSNSIKKSDSKADENTGKTSDQVPVSKDMSSTITQLEQTGDVIRFTATIQNSTANGKCVLTFTNPNDRPVTKEFDATTKDGVTICGPIEVPSLEFSYLGEWAVSFRYYIGAEQTTSTGKVTIR